ncbi:DUF4345 domain-containing protein [Streptomyces sp. AB3(2024)]|uniref:DUF4345 domain-containing protein n=1 Tax=Streptomyces sp. AB3(2024) TaxID=3317321 RepID=UPI0035A2ABEF
MSRHGLLKGLAWAMGVACVAIGLYHLVLGIVSVPGTEGAGPAAVTVDSRERFYNAIFVGFGLAWIETARRTPVPARAVRWLSAVFLLGGVGRVLSVAVHGWPHWFQIPLAALELGLPPLYFWLADADERRAAGAARGDGVRTV